MAFYPKFDFGEESQALIARETKEFLFFVDISSSMKGEPFEDLKRSLKKIIDKLSSFNNTKFNIITFGSNWQSLFVDSRWTNDTIAVALAHEFASKLAPNGGGTELYEPLRSAYFLGGTEEVLLPKNIFLLSDGHPTNLEQVSFCHLQFNFHIYSPPYLDI